ncbi:histone-like nucleoid-structuring protein Lsr2 [Williamsia sp. CHRR-6]|uniref:Lsr2 family DNA-binding protein n=1 Tax=Williamsia sp. CHRR-6 TaxID=2835871 RepID=UPI0027DB17F3|nr:histone-like nucleoid-structuring protein Lsr2 [Williamsia sp. CHRR-6]
MFKVKNTWPREAKIYCHRVDEWPGDVEVIGRVPLRSVGQRGAAIDIVAERARESRSPIVVTRARGREMVFWQSRRTARQARPNVTLPTARAHGAVLDIVVDSGEKYAYSFGHQQASVRKQRLAVGDYAVFDADVMVATVERKSVADLASSLLKSTLKYNLAEMSSVFRAAVVVESGYSKVFDLEFASGSAVAEAVAEMQVAFPAVRIVFCDNRKMAQERTYRFLGAAQHEWRLTQGASAIDTERPATRPDVVRPSAAAADIRQWARANGFEVSDRGRISAEVANAFAARVRE